MQFMEVGDQDVFISLNLFANISFSQINKNMQNTERCILYGPPVRYRF